METFNEPEIKILLKNFFNKENNKNNESFLGRKNELSKLINLLEQENGGSYLISGYRGVGKTRFVNKALELYKNKKGKNIKKVIEVRVNLGSDSKLSSRGILTDIVFLLKESIEEKIKSKVNKKIFKIEKYLPLLLIISSFTSLIFTISYFISQNKNFVKPELIDLTLIDPQWILIGIALLVMSYSTMILSFLILSYSFVLKKFSNFIEPLLELEALQKEILSSYENNISVGNPAIATAGIKEITSVLDNNQIESKLIKILKNISRKGDGIKIIFIFDELDKLTGRISEKPNVNIDLIKESKIRKSQVDSLLGDLKNLITTSSALYFFIAGRDMYDAYLSERGSANSLYESLFNDHIYIPSLLTDRSDEEVYVLDSMIEAFVVAHLIQLHSHNKNKEPNVFERLITTLRRKFGYFSVNINKDELILNNNLEKLKLSYLASEKEKNGDFFKNMLARLIKVSNTSNDIDKSLERRIDVLTDLSRNIKESDSSEQKRLFFLELNNLNSEIGKINKKINQKFNEIEIKEIDELFQEEENEKINQIHTLKLLIHFLALHSWGNYKRLITLFESFIRLKPNTSQYILHFTTKDIQRIVLASHLYIMFHHNLSRMLMNADDKLVVSSFSVFLHIMKYHGIGFSRENILRMYETINIHSSPELIRIVDIILNKVLISHIRIIRRSGIHRYRFSYLHERGIHFITNLKDDESAAFNFSLNAMDAVKQHYRTLISDSKYTHAEEGYGHIALASIHVIVGDFHFWEQAFDEASIHYGIASDILERNFNSKTENKFVENKNSIILQLIEVYLKLGSVAERMGNNGKAESIYNEALRKSDEYFQTNRREDKEENPEWGILLQPRWAKSYLQLKHSSFNYVTTKSITTKASKYKEAVLLFFMGKYPQAYSGFLQVGLEIYHNESKSYFLLGNSYLRAAFCLLLNFSSTLHIKLSRYDEDSQFDGVIKSALESISNAMDGIEMISDVDLDKFEREILEKQRLLGDHFIDPEYETEIIKLAYGLLRLSTKYFTKGKLNIDSAISSLSILMFWQIIMEILPWKIIRENPEFNLINLENKIKKIRTNNSDNPSTKRSESLIMKYQRKSFSSISYNTNNAFFHFIKTSLHKNLGKDLKETLLGRHQEIRDLVIDSEYLNGNGIYQQHSIFGQVLIANIYWEAFAYHEIDKNSQFDLEGLRNGFLLPYGIRYYTIILWLKARLYLKDTYDQKYDLCNIVDKNNDNKELLSIAINSLILLFRSSQYVIKTHGDSSIVGIPPLHIIYYNMWEVLYRLLLLYKKNSNTFDCTKAILHLRDILDDHLHDYNYDIKDISSRVFDMSHIEKIALEQFKTVEQIGDLESMNRINIMRNKYYLDDDYEDNVFNLDWTYCRFFAPGSIIYKTIIKTKMKELNYNCTPE